MGDLPVCKLCGCQPTRNPDGKLGHKRGSRCKLVSAVYFNDEEWQTLMAAPGGEACSRCKGECGRTEEEFHGDRITEVHWIDCEHCNGTGEEPRTAPAVDDGVLRDAIAEAIGLDTYDCTRVWSAWGYGTMSPDDFVPIVQCEERLQEIVDAVKVAMKGA